MTTSGPIHPHQKKRGANYIWRACRRWQNTLILVVNSNGKTYVIVISIPAEENRYI
jgi:hypothetical protein